MELRRLRWRLAGATMWPAFVAFVVLGTILLVVLPFAGEGELGAVPAFLLCGFLALAVVAAGAPLGGWLLRRRDRALPKVVADDRAGTLLLGLLFLVLLGGGLLHRGAVQRADDDLVIQALAARNAVMAQAPPEFARNIAQLDTAKQGPTLFRSCVPGRTDRESWCVLVSTDQHPPGVTLDPDRRPNDVVAGPRNPGRRGG